MVSKALFQGKPSEFNPEESFKQAFADLSVHKDEFGGYSQKYWDPMQRVNKLEQMKDSLMKSSISTQTGGAGTAGTAMVPVYVDSTIVDRTIRETPLRNMLQRRAVKGLTYDYVPLTSKGGASFAFENAAIADQVDVYDRESVPIKFLYAKGRVSGPAIAAMRGFIDPSQLDLTVKSTSIMEAEEDMIINGDASTNPEEPNGLIVSITTNTTDLSSAYPTLPQIRAQIALSDQNNGDVRIAVTDINTHNYIKGLLFDIQRQPINPSMEMMGFGIPEAFGFDRLMFIHDKFMPQTSGSRRILFLDPRYMFMAVLQDLTYEEKASENDTYVYILKEYLSFVLTHEAACTQIYGIL